MGPSNQPEVAAALTDYAHAVRRTYIYDGRAHDDETDRIALEMEEKAALETLRQSIIRNIGTNETLEVWANDLNRQIGAAL